MTNDDTRSTTDASNVQDVPVDWEALEDAFENNAPEVHSYLHLKTGEVLRVVDGIADPEMHSRIAADNRYMRIEPVSSREQYRWMERFIQMLETSDLREALTQAIDGKGAFRRFKDVLMSRGEERERWFAFRSERLRVFMEAWLAAHALRPVKRAEPPPAAEEISEETLVQEGVSTRRSRGADGLRRQIKDAIGGLGARDLDKVLAFAEFVKARRGTRGLSGHQESVAETTHQNGPVAVPTAEEEEPPSSRKLPAARSGKS